MRRVSRNYNFLLHGTSMSEREIADDCGVCRRSLIRLRRYPYGAEESFTIRTAEEVGKTFGLPDGWICMTPEVRLGLGLEGGHRVPPGTVEGIRDQFPGWSFSEGSKILILLAQHTPIEVAQDIVK